MNTTASVARLRKGFLGLSLLWFALIALIALLCAWNYRQIYEESVNGARLSAREHFARDVPRRSWVTRHAGVYAPIAQPPPRNSSFQRIGGEAFSRSWAPYREGLYRILFVQVLGFGAIWLIGLLGLRAYRRRLGNHMARSLHAEDTLRKRESDLREAQEVGRIGSYVFDIPANAWVSSPMLDAIFGIDADFPRTVAGWTQLVHRAERAAMTAHFKQAIKDRTRFEREFRIVRASDGMERWVLGQGKVDYDAGGAPVRMAGTIQDITARKQAEEDVRASQALFKTVFDQAPLGITLVESATGRIQSVNPMFAKIAGRTMEEMERIDWMAITHPDDLQEDLNNMALLNAGKIPGFQMDKRYLRPGGSAVWVNMTIAPVNVENEEHMRHLCIVEDITERKRVEAERARQEGQQREAQKMAALGTLAGGVAHDFNNVLAVIVGNAERARQDVGPAHPALESLAEIEKASRRARDLVQQILAFGRPQAIERTAMTLAPVIQEAARFLRSTIPAGVGLNVECAPDTPAVLADATQIGQVVINLVGNAWQAIDGQERAGLIEVRLEAQVRGELGFATLTVRDNGRGMDEATRARVFEPFFTTRPVHKGTGLGLSVVYAIAQSHQADIEVHSSPGEGTAVVIRFPAAQPGAASVPATAARGGDTHTAAAPASQPDGKRILYVDDEEGIVVLMKRLLERRGYRVSGYTAPLEALAAVRANPDRFDLVVTDYNMPLMSGLELTLALKEIRADLPVVLASGYITEKLRAEAPAAGISELFYKPSTVDDLCEAVERCANKLGAKGRAP